MVNNPDASSACHRQCGWAPWPENEDYCLHFARLLEVAQEGASAISECLITAGRITPGDDESWYREWNKVAEVSSARGKIAFAGDNLATAQASWLRASSYFRTAALFLKFGDVRRRLALAQMRESSVRHLELMTPPGELVRIANFDGEVEGYFLRAFGATSPTPAVVCIGGPEHLKDEHLYTMRRHARDRGLSLLLVDLLEPDTFERKKLLRRHDVAMSIVSCIDYLISRGDIDENRIAIYGDGLGASFASQAAAQDPRISAAVCDGGVLDLLQRAFSFQQLVGAEDCDFIERNFENLKRLGIGKRISCPILVKLNEGDWFDPARAAESSTSSKASDLNISSKFISRPGAATFDSRSLDPTIANESIFDWIAERLKKDAGSNCKDQGIDRLEFGS